MRYVLTPLFILLFLLVPALGLAELSCPNLHKADVSSDNKGDIVMICLAAKNMISEI